MNTVEIIAAKGEILSNFSLCHAVFKGLLLQRRQKASICGKGFMWFIDIHVSTSAMYIFEDFILMNPLYQIVKFIKV